MKEWTLQDVTMYGAVLPTYSRKNKDKNKEEVIYADDIEGSDKLLGITR